MIYKITFLIIQMKEKNKYVQIGRGFHITSYTRHVGFDETPVDKGAFVFFTPYPN